MTLRSVKLARLTALSGDVQVAVAERGTDYRTALACNTSIDLDPRVWSMSYPAKPKPAASLAGDLVSRPLTGDQLDHVLAVETRGTVLASLVRYNVLDDARLETLIASKGFGPKVAEALLVCEWLPADRIAELSRTAGGTEALRWLCDHRDELSSDEVIAYVEGMGTSPGAWKARDRKSLLGWLITSHPALLAVAGRPDAPMALRQAASGHRLLTDADAQLAVAGLDIYDEADDDTRVSLGYVWMALVNNPSCHRHVVETIDKLCDERVEHKVRDSVGRRLTGWDTKPQVSVPWDQVDDEGTLRRLVARTVTTVYDDQLQPGRPWDVIALATNPHLDDSQASRLAGEIAEDGDISDEVADAALSALAEAHPDLGRFRRGELTRDARLASQAARAALPRETAKPYFTRDTDRTSRITLDPDLAARDISVIEGDSWVAPRVCGHIAATVGDDVDAWNMVLDMIDTWSGTIADLLAVAEAL